MASPSHDKARETRKRLDCCWDLDLDWNKYPHCLKEVWYNVYSLFWQATAPLLKKILFCYSQACGVPVQASSRLVPVLLKPLRWRVHLLKHS